MIRNNEFKTRRDPASGVPFLGFAEERLPQYLYFSCQFNIKGRSLSSRHHALVVTLTMNEGSTHF